MCTWFRKLGFKKLGRWWLLWSLSRAIGQTCETSGGRTLCRAFDTLIHHLKNDVSYNRCLRERVIALAENGVLSASTAGEHYGVPMFTAREWLGKYRRDGQVGRRKGTGLWRVSSPAQHVALVYEAYRNLFLMAMDLKAATGFRNGQRFIAEVSYHWIRTAVRRSSYSVTVLWRHLGRFVCTRLDFWESWGQAEFPQWVYDMSSLKLVEGESAPSQPPIFLTISAGTWVLWWYFL